MAQKKKNPDLLIGCSDHIVRTFPNQTGQMLIQTHGSNTGYQAAPLFEFPGVQSKFHESFAVGLHPVCYRGCPDLFFRPTPKGFRQVVLHAR